MTHKQETYVLYAIIAISAIQIILALFGVIGSWWGFTPMLILATLSIGGVIYRLKELLNGSAN